MQHLPVFGCQCCNSSFCVFGDESYRETQSCMILKLTDKIDRPKLFFNIALWSVTIQYYVLFQVLMQSSILAGGVAVGVSMPVIHQPWEAMTMGFVSAVISTIGYRYLKVFITTYYKMNTIYIDFN